MTLDVRSTVDAIADRLRQDICDGRLRPGQAIRQGEVAARFGVSRIPLREALRQLKAEGIIVYRPNRGAVVATIDEAMVHEIFGVRRILEEGAIRLVIHNVNNRLIAQLRTLARDLGREKDTRAFVRKHHEFHCHLYEASGNTMLASAVSDHSIRVASIPHATEMVRRVVAISKRDHERLLAALEGRDLMAALAATMEHLAHMEEAMVAALAGDA